MEPHDPRDLDAVIDDVARALTSTGPARDLRHAVASRIASRPSWPFGWRVGMAAAVAVAVVVLAVVMRPAPGPQGPRPVAEGGAPSVVPAAASALTETAAPVATERRPVVREARVAAARQTIGGATVTDGMVEIRPVAIVPLEDDGAAAESQALVVIEPIDVEPVRISQLGELVE